MSSQDWPRPVPRPLDLSAEGVARAAADAHRIVDANRYVVLGTTDPSGLPWASPVYFAADGLDRFWWVSRPYVRHSVNLAARPDCSLVVFDSTAGVGLAEAFYARATATVVPDDEVDDQIGIFSRRSEAHGGWPWSLARVREAGLRLYAADVTERSALVQGGPAERTPL